jgi:hypothetical protein
VSTNRNLLRRLTQFAVAAALAVFALVVPGVGTAQAASTVCANQPFPAGYIVTAVSTGSCQGFLDYTIALPSNGAKACAVGAAEIPAGWVITGSSISSQPQCANEFPTDTVYQPYNGIQVCLGSTFPSPYVITAITSGIYAPCDGQAATLTQQYTGIVACANTAVWTDWVVTAVSSGSACASYGLETLAPAYDGIMACGQGPNPAGYVITLDLSSYSGCGLDHGLRYNLPYNGIHACSDSTLPSGWYVTSTYSDTNCGYYQGETLAS